MRASCASSRRCRPTSRPTRRRAPTSAAKLKTLEEAVTGATSDVREEAEKQLAAAKAAAQQADRRQQALKRRESGLAKELQEDQARWQELNARLENFEQSIPGK